MGTLRVPGEAVPVTDCSHCKNFLAYIKMKSLQARLVHNVPCSLCVGPCDERPSMLVVGAPKAVENCHVFHPKASLFHSEKTEFLRLSSKGSFSSPLLVFVVLLWTLNQSFLGYGEPELT